MPGDRVVEIGRAGPGDIVGEIGLLDGGAHTMSVQATETATVLALGRQDFAALLARQHPSAFELKRRLAALFTARLRNQLEQLAALARRERRPAGDDPPRRSPSWSPAARPTAGTCAAWRRSTTSIRWRCGAS